MYEHFLLFLHLAWCFLNVKQNQNSRLGICCSCSFKGSSLHTSIPLPWEWLPRSCVTECVSVGVRPLFAKDQVRAGLRNPLNWAPDLLCLRTDSFADQITAMWWVLHSHAHICTVSHTHSITSIHSHTQSLPHAGTHRLTYTGLHTHPVTQTYIHIEIFCTYIHTCAIVYICKIYMCLCVYIWS